MSKQEIIDFSIKKRKEGWSWSQISKRLQKIGVKNSNNKPITKQDINGYVLKAHPEMQILYIKKHRKNNKSRLVNIRPNKFNLIQAVWDSGISKRNEIIINILESN